MIKWTIQITKWHREVGMAFLCSLFLLFSLAPTLKAEDPYEPNNSFDTATPIDIGDIIEATIEPAGDLDYFQFQGTANWRITIDIDARTLGPPSLLDSVICLYDASETELARNDDYRGSDSLIVFTPPKDGIYYLKVEDYNSAGGKDYFYLLKLLGGLEDPYEPNNDFDTATPINFGDVISATLAPPRDLDYLQFSGFANQQITINIDAQSLSPPSLLDSVICLYDASETELARNDDYDGSDSLILHFLLPKDGIYYLKVVDANSAGGDDYFYDLRLSELTDAYEPNDDFEAATPIDFGDVISATIVPVGDLDYFQFNGRAGQGIKIYLDAQSLDSPSLLESVLRLYDANRRQIAYSGYDQILYTLPTDGVYYIRVEDYYDKGGEDYFYLLQLTGDIHDVTVSNRTDSGVTISWWTHGEIPVTGIVNYGPTTELGSTATDDQLRKNGIHYVEITGLPSETQYFFEVVSGENTDDNNGQYYTFITAKVPQKQPEPYNVFGYVYDYMKDGSRAAHVIKYFWLKSGRFKESSLLSALTNDKGYWVGDLSNAKSNETNDVFSFTAGEDIYAYAHFGVDTPGGSHKTLISRYIVSGVSPQQLGDEVPLAVELSSFTAVVTFDGVTLKWRTISEINNLGFNVYRSTQKDGKDILVNTKLIDGAGTDATPHDYSLTDENVKVGQTYYYYLESVDFSGNTEKSNIIEVTMSKQNIKELPLSPITFALRQNYPNPFNPETWIPFQLAKYSPVTISIYNANGQLIRTLSLGNKNAGIYNTKDKAAYWDGRDKLGEKVSSGVYFYHMQASEYKAMRKMVIVK